ncbi:hypothetical protein BT96DRAFT_395466 [Gymnopus androsaceus JB14]|uniref:CHAT domain-containing protein n=1 Tax=Gymnopus androsaceus JB14 TaxID=1447944 RepID=A0A6A4I4K6_9AGAR|nr:hypothetical protein BT96DRAFT_395466 [Gymnopus androsaceus JB14]
MNLSSSQSVQDQLGKKRFRVNILFDEAAAMVGGGYVDPEKPALEQLNKLAAAGTWALQLYDSINSVDRVDSAIAIMKIVVENTPENHPEQSQYLYTLGSAFFQRFGQLGTFSDLEEAIPLQRRAVALVPDTDPSKPKYLNGLGVSLVKRSRHLESLKDVEEALIVHRRAVDLTPRNHHLYPGFSSDIGDAFCAHFELSGEIKALSIAIETQKYALKHIHEKHPDRAIYLHRFCTSLLIRFRHFRDNIDIEEAIDAQYRAVRIIPPGHTFKSILLIDLAHALSTRMKHRPNHSDFNEAFKLFIDEGDHPSRPSLKLDAALQLAELCSTYPQFSSPDMLLRAYTFVFEAIPQVVWLGNGINQRLQSLIRIGSVFNAAAAAAIATGNSGRALEWVEQGRSVVWRQILHLRAPLDDLRRHYPTLDLPDRLEQVSVALENTGGLMRDADLLHDKDNFPQLSLRMTPESETLSDYTQHTHRLATEYEKLLTEVRKLDGFESFLKPKLSRELACAAKSSFVVVINVDKTRCDALVICPDEELIHVPLPELTYEVVKSMQSQLASALQKISLRNRSRLSISSKSFHHSYDDVERILSGLWQLIVKPILKQIGLLPDPLSRTAPNHLKTSCLPHITWCACGPLSFLPLHAAGDYDPKGERMRVSDLAVSSYTPTLDALLKPRFNISFPDSILVVSQSSTPGYPSLPGVNEEVSKIKGHFLDPPVLEGQNATMDAVFDAMDKCSWIPPCLPWCTER